MEKETEANPLVVGHVSSFLFLAHIRGHDTRMGNLDSNMQGQGSWDGISGMDPAVEVEHVVWHIFVIIGSFIHYIAIYHYVVLDTERQCAANVLAAENAAAAAVADIAQNDLVW